MNNLRLRCDLMEQGNDYIRKSTCLFMFIPYSMRFDLFVEVTFAVLFGISSQ
jgi:hypothetical protein